MARYADVLAPGANAGLWSIPYGITDPYFFASPAPLRERAGRLDDFTNSGGLLAVVRGQTIWLGSGSQLVTWTRGHAPSLVSDESRVVFVRGGWVWSSDLARGEGFRRIVRGGAPTISSDGRSLAYVGAGHHVFVLSLRGGKPRQVGHLRATTLDSAPAPRGATCRPPPGQVVARSSQGAVWKTFSSPGDTNISSLYGCAFGIGITRSLAVVTDQGGNEFSLGPVALAGNFAAMELAAGDHRRTEGPDNVVVYDLRTGGGVAQSTDLCSVQDGVRGACAQVDSLQVTTRGFAAPHQLRRPGGNPAIPIAETVSPDDTGVRTLDSVPEGGGQSLTQIRLGSNSITWLHDGVPRSAALR